MKFFVFRFLGGSTWVNIKKNVEKTEKLLSLTKDFPKYGRLEHLIIYFYHATLIMYVDYMQRT